MAPVLPGSYPVNPGEPAAPLAAPPLAPPRSSRDLTAAPASFESSGEQVKGEQPLTGLRNRLRRLQRPWSSRHLALNREESALAHDAARVKADYVTPDSPSGTQSLCGSTKKRRERSESSGEPCTRLLDVDTARWMSSLPDEAKLDELYLPGTHDSLALHFPFLSSICQTTSLTAQLRGGIRFLDFRFALLDDGSLWAYHGAVPQRKSADDAFEEVYRWLESDEGRRECVVISCKQENPAPLFSTAMWALLDRTPRSRAIWYDEDRWPALGDVRGKCVMFCRFGWGTKRGLHPPRWPNDQRTAWSTSIGGRETLVQDWYGLANPLVIPRKAALALSLFSTSTSSLLPSPSPRPSSLTQATIAPGFTDQAPPLPLRINFLSCASFPGLYPSIAAKGFGLPSFRLGFRGVNELVLAGLARLKDRTGEEARRGRRYEKGQGGMVVLLDFWEFPRTRQREDERGALAREVVRMNFA
ncbi:uncharacterized protein JCM10292_002619 [Rhodotorula paludigena]|uniref:uncharacterized protein n=1 Tax=Rhodotorula paludigena TaxID=86838 RepID=UPI0031732110